MRPTSSWHRRRSAFFLGFAAVGLAVLPACGSNASSSTGGSAPTPQASTPTTATPGGSTPPTSPAPGETPAAPSLPGVGPAMMGKIPANSTQVVLVTGAGTDAATNTVSFWERDGTGWRKVSGDMAAHNGAKGWTTNHREGDLRSPAGVYSLTYGGGRLANPGAKIPYEYRPSYYVISGTFLGGNLAGAFDYVVGIDYNHIPGTPPSDTRKPQGAAAGGGIWFHVDHNSPTHACVSLVAPDMQKMLLWLNPTAHPVTVMGSAAQLA